jgi:hypothetical protein
MAAADLVFGPTAAFYFVDAQRAARWQRVLQRNAEKGATSSFNLTAPMFDSMELSFEHPDSADAQALGRQALEPPND